MAVGDAGALYLMENGYPNFLSLTYGVPKLDELCKKYKKQRRRIKEAGRYIDQSDTITSNDKANLKKILHIK